MTRDPLTRPYSDSDTKTQSEWGHAIGWGLGTAAATMALVQGIARASRGTTSLYPRLGMVTAAAGLVVGTTAGLLGHTFAQSHNRTAHFIQTYEQQDALGPITPDRLPRLSPHLQKADSYMGGMAKGALKGAAISVVLDTLLNGISEQRWTPPIELAVGAVDLATFGAAIGFVQAAEHNKLRDIHTHFAAKAEANQKLGFAGREDAKTTAQNSLELGR